MTPWLSRGARTFARSLALFGLWMVFVDNLHQAEIVTGLVVAAAGGLLWSGVQGARGEQARLSPAMLRHVHRPFVLLVTDTGRLALALTRRLAGRPAGGRFRAVRYRATHPDREDRARRILTEWSASLAANRYVIGIDPEAGYLLVHELVRSTGPLDPLELG